MDGVLYFPYMRVPLDAWFTRVLMYWDTVSAIIPPSYVGNGETLGRYGIDLIEHGLLTRIFPDEHHLPGLAAGFRTILEGEQDAGRRSRQRDGSVDRTLVHVTKMSLDPAAELQELGLARPARQLGGGFWYAVERRTASLYMAYLAVVLGRQAGISPITDDPSAIAILDNAQRADRLHLAVVDAILPAPEQAIPIDELRRFKTEQGEELVRLRTHVESAVLDIINEGDSAVRDRRVWLLRQDVRSHVSQLQREMTRPKWPRVLLGGVCGVGAAVAPMLAAAAGASITESLLTVPGFLSGVYGALGSLRDQPRATESPFAYAALAQEKFPQHP